VFHNTLAAQSTDTLLVPYRQGEKWGYADIRKTIVIPCQFDEALFFKNGYAVVKRKTFIENLWEVGVIKPDQQFSIGFEVGLLEDRQDFKRLDFLKGVEAYYFSDSAGKALLSFVFEDGHIAPIPQAPPFAQIISIEESLGLVFDCMGNMQCGFVDLSGKMVIPIEKLYASPFSEGLSGFGIWDKPSEMVRYGFQNKRGEVVIAPIYESIGRFVEGMAAVRLGQKWSFVDKTGKIILANVSDHSAVTLKFSEGLYFQEGRAAVLRNGKWGFIDKKGDLVVPCLYDDVGAFSEGLAAARLGTKWGFVGRNGEVVIDFQFADDFGRNYMFMNWLAAVRQTQEGLLGFIDAKGVLVIDYAYTEVEDIHFSINSFQSKRGFNPYGFALVCDPNQQWYYIDKQGVKYAED
jgi:hypothetical protein